jgi:GT2 family glycosyltransferase
MGVSLIISIYKLQAELPLLISALAQQSHTPDEIIFAEDDISLDTIKILKEESNKYSHLSMKLVQHEDRGFRKAEIVNKAVAIAENEKLIFLDGDCLPHHHYVKVYAQNVAPSKLLNARPVRLFIRDRSLFIDYVGRYSQASTLSVLWRADPPRRYSLYLPYYPINQRNSAMYGSSWACMKNDLISVNGYDEKFCVGGYGYEDTDLSHRFNRAGVQCYVPKFRAIYYHFFDPTSRESKDASKVTNKRLLESNDKTGLIQCQRGLSQWIGKIQPVWVS